MYTNKNKKTQITSTKCQYQIAAITPKWLSYNAYLSKLKKTVLNMMIPINTCDPWKPVNE